MTRQGRILVVDDLERWREGVSDTLRRGGFRVDTAASISQVWDRLAETFYHLFILDISMDDADQTNTEGMRLLQELDDRYGSALAIFMLSAYGTREQMRKAFREHQVADFLAKEDFDNIQFLEQICQYFAGKILINLDLEIQWEGLAGPAEAVLHVKIEDQRVRQDTRLQRRLGLELDDLLCRLFHEAEKLKVRTLVPGFSGAGVLWTQPVYSDGMGQIRVVKFGDVPRIDEEYRNFKAYVEPFLGGARNTTVQDLRRTPLLGGLIYTFLGTASNQLEDFGSFYRRAETSEILEALDHLFWDTLSPWYSNPKEAEPLDLGLFYQRSFGLEPDQLQQLLSEKSLAVQCEPELRFESLDTARTFRNPVLTYAGRNLVKRVSTCITHGDLNGRNILLDQSGQTWLIDFRHTGHGHILRDVAKLDSVVRFELLSAQEATVEERLQMEEALSHIESFGELSDLASRFSRQNSALAKAFSISIYLRSVAQKLVGQASSSALNEYHLATFYHALNAVRFKSLQPIQRQHALLSASLLADCLGL